MTQTVRHFAALDDITALRVECLKCKTSLSIPVAVSAFSTPTSCPTCGADWYDSYGNGRSVGEIMAALAQQLKLLRRAMENKNAGIGFSVDVEVSGLAAFPASSTRDV